MRYAILLVVVATALSACQSSRDEAGQRSDGFPAPAKELVYDAAERALKRQGFIVDGDASSPRTWILRTRWLVSLSPFSGQGHRDQATVRILDVPGRPGYFRVETNVTREWNDNVTEPDNPIRADWARPTRVEELENIITREVEMAFLPSGPSTEFRRRFGLPGSPSPRLENLDPPEEDDEEPDDLGDFFSFP